MWSGNQKNTLFLFLSKGYFLLISTPTSYSLRYNLQNIINIFFSVVICEALQLPENGDVAYNASLDRNGGYPIDTFASFVCHYGYTLNGSNSSACKDPGSWNQQTPTCEQGNEKNTFPFSV